MATGVSLNRTLSALEVEQGGVLSLTVRSKLVPLFPKMFPDYAIEIFGSIKKSSAVVALDFHSTAPSSKSKAENEKLVILYQ